MALKDITPVMTSNTTPAPYVVSASSYLDSTRLPYYVFDNTLNYWHSTQGYPQWLKLDFGASTKVSAISITSDGIHAPKNFIIYASNDDAVYEKILECNSEIGWVNGESRLFRFPISTTYRYYKVVISADNGYTYAIIREMKFWQDDGTTEYITNSKASMNYCLPKNTTLAMTQRQNDPREGFLGFASDDNNYGTLWMVNNKGQAEIPKANMTNADVLFDGVANTKGSTYTLNNDYSNYKYLIILGGVDNGQSLMVHLLVPVKMINNSTSNQFVIDLYATSAYYYYLAFYFNSKTTFNISDKIIGVNWTNCAISKIYGIK